LVGWADLDKARLATDELVLCLGVPQIDTWVQINEHLSLAIGKGPSTVSLGRRKECEVVRGEK
jgi:hypothetical protein